MSPLAPQAAAGAPADANDAGAGASLSANASPPRRAPSIEDTGDGSCSGSACISAALAGSPRAIAGASS
eukprot:215935-Chlamydomonas_euryale.AAC.1